ncbi:MAG: choice-of-anchor D domain-containing protein [Phycisphaerae bacterium]
MTAFYRIPTVSLPRPSISTARTATLCVVVLLALVRSSSAQRPATLAGAKAEHIERLVRDLSARRATLAAEQGGPCVETATMSTMFDATATEADLTAALDNLSDSEFGEAAFQPFGRWFATATDGALQEGQPLTITYSFVPDGTVIQTSYNDQPESSVLFATLDGNFPGGRDAWKAAFAQVFARWGELSNITYVEVADDGASFNNSPGALGLRGDVRIGMVPLGVPLAVNYYPASGGDMVLDADDVSDFIDASQNFRSLRNILAHEHGHGLGLKHVDPVSNTKLMEPFKSTAFDGPQEDDIRGIQHIYGDRAEPNEQYGEELFVGGPLRPEQVAGPIVLTVEEVALERNDSVDWFGFTAFADSKIAIRVEPIGTTYESGPQDGTPVEVNARAARNLGIRLWRRVSSQTGELDLLSKIDFNDAGADEYHPPIRFTLAGYMLVEVFSNDEIDDVQRYKLTISNRAIEEAQGEPDMLVVQGISVINDGGTLQFPVTELGQNSGQALTIQNNGTGPLVFTESPRVEGPAAGDFALGNLPAQIDAGGLAVFGINFVPTAVGQRVAVVTIPNNDPDASDFSFIVRGTAVEPIAPVLELSVNGQPFASGDTLDLGELELGVEQQIDLDITNTGNATLTVNNLIVVGSATTADARRITDVPVSVGPNQTGTVAVGFTATAEEVQTARFSLSNNSATGFFIVNLTATGASPNITDCNGNGTPDDQDIAAGTSADCNENAIPDDCETDADGDGLIDDCDGCPNDPDKGEPGTCGCGVSDLDADGDGLANCEDAFPDDPTNAGNDTNPDPTPDPTPEQEDRQGGLCGMGGGMGMMMAMVSLCGLGRARRRRASGLRTTRKA